MDIYSHRIFDENIIETLNNDYLVEINCRIIIGEDLDPYTDHFIERDHEKIFRTIYPQELLVKIAQLIPESEVRLGSYEIQVGDKVIHHETLVLRLSDD
jgi:hypothetical protein